MLAREHDAFVAKGSQAPSLPRQPSNMATDRPDDKERFTVRLGLFGGSFDPVHYGHLLLAECCREACRLDRVLFLPAGVPPHKRQRKLAQAEARVEMLKLALGGDPQMDVSRYDVDREDVAYTVGTLLHFGDEYPQSELFFLMGADMLHDLPHWHQSQRVCQLAIPVVVRRAGTEEPDFGRLEGIASAERIETIRRHQVEMPAIGISSTDIRRRVAAGHSIRYRTPRGVEEMISAQGLYTDDSDAG